MGTVDGMEWFGTADGRKHRTQGEDPSNEQKNSFDFGIRRLVVLRKR
jgi:hypothetical protein